MSNTQDEFKINKIDLKHINPSILRGDKLYYSLLPPKNAVFIGDFAPEIHQPPVITGPKSIVSTLSCFPGVYKGRPYPDITYQWYSDGVAIAGETNQTLVTFDDLWRTDVTCEVSATSTLGQIVTMSNIIVPTFPLNTVDDYFEGDWAVPFTSHDLLDNDGMGEGVDPISGFELLFDTITNNPTGNFTYNDDGTITYSAGDFTESGKLYTIDYRLTDAIGQQDTGTISMRVTGVWLYLTDLNHYSLIKRHDAVEIPQLTFSTLVWAGDALKLTDLSYSSFVTSGDELRLTQLRIYSFYTES